MQQLRKREILFKKKTLDKETKFTLNFTIGSTI
jgi:hypothetical protein